MEFHTQEIRLGEHCFQVDYAKEVDAAAQPAYWASLWPSAVALAGHLLRRDDLTDKQVLEVGCGCGLAGIAAAKRGAEVTVTDLLPEALALAEINWRQNQLRPAALQSLDWCNPACATCFELILGADILYHPPDFPDLVRSLCSLLESGGTLILSEPGRPQAHEFFARMLQAGFEIDTVHYHIPLHGESSDISVSEFH